MCIIYSIFIVKVINLSIAASERRPVCCVWLVKISGGKWMWENNFSVCRGYIDIYILFSFLFRFVFIIIISLENRKSVREDCLRTFWCIRKINWCWCVTIWMTEPVKGSLFFINTHQVLSTTQISSIMNWYLFIYIDIIKTFVCVVCVSI